MVPLLEQKKQETVQKDFFEAVPCLSHFLIYAEIGNKHLSDEFFIV